MYIDGFANFLLIFVQKYFLPMFVDFEFEIEKQQSIVYRPNMGRYDFCAT